MTVTPQPHAEASFSPPDRPPGTGASSADNLPAVIAKSAIQPAGQAPQEPVESQAVPAVPPPGWCQSRF